MRDAEAVTLSFWMLPMQQPDATLTTYLAHCGTSGLGNRFAVSLSSTMQVEVVVPGVNSESGHRDRAKYVSRSAVVLDAWTHVAVVVDSADQSMRLYINGKLDYSSELSVSVRLTEALSKPWFLGQVDPAYSRRAAVFTGKFEDVRFYNRSLADPAVAAIAKQLPVQLDCSRTILSAAQPTLKLLGDDIADSAALRILEEPGAAGHLEEKAGEEHSVEVQWKALLKDLQTLQLLASEEGCGLSILKSQLSAGKPLMSVILDVVDGCAKLVKGRDQDGGDEEFVHPVMVESEHSYADNTRSWQLLHVEGATGMNVWFDAQSRTEPNYDFVRFYAEENMSSRVYGLDKYR